jgi:quercetin dioxygenase-like cupin family protein
MSTAPAPRPIAADPLKVDPKHYKVEFENDHMRVLRVKYGPHEKSVMHSHPATLAIFLTENRARFTFPGGKTEERGWAAGQVMSIPAEEHLPENLTDKPLELVLVELKS